MRFDTFNLLCDSNFVEKISMKYKEKILGVALMKESNVDLSREIS